MQVYFEPEKKWWQVWKKNCFLVEGKDFNVNGKQVILTKPLKGKLQFTYDVKF